MGWAAPIEKAQKAKDKRLEKEALKQYETMSVPNVPTGMNRGFETNPDGTLDIQGTLELAEANRQLVMEGNTGDIIDLIDPTQDVLRFFTERDPLTDVKLSKTERGMALLFLFPFAKAGKTFKFAFRGVEDVERLKKFGEISKIKKAKIPENIEVILTPAQKKSIKRINNNIEDHLTQGDFSGTRRDLMGNSVPKKGEPGKYWNHLDEMINTYKSLKSSKRSIENSLKNPKLPINARTFLRGELAKANMNLQKIDKLFNEFGGIDKWLEK